MDPTYGRAKAGRPARTYIVLCEDTGCRLEDQSKAMNDKEEWREGVRDIHASDDDDIYISKTGNAGYKFDLHT